MAKALNTPNCTSNPKKPRWKIVLGYLTKNYVLLLVLLLLTDMILRMMVSENNNAMQFQFEGIDRNFEKKIEALRTELSKRISENDVVFGANSHDLYARVESMEKSLELIWEDKFNKLLDELSLNTKKWIDNACNGDIKLNEMKVFVKQIIDKEMEKHAADGIGRVDYAVAAGGGMVVKHSEPYAFGNHKQLMEDDQIHLDAQKLLQPSFGEPGQCFPLKGNNGFVHIRLRKAIIPEAISLEHVAKSVAYDRSTAPKECRVFGWFHNSKIDSEKMVLLAEFSYDLGESNVQSFNVYKRNVLAVNIIRFEFTSNHGNPYHTCIYRLRVHGHDLDSPSALIPRTLTNDSNAAMIILR